MTRKRASFHAAAATLAATAGVLVAGGQMAFGEPSGHASCIGIEVSVISPPGSSDEFPGGTRELIAFVQGLGGPPGGVVGAVAKLHEGSHEACDEATEG
jgi:hypothetical protein